MSSTLITPDHVVDKTTPLIGGGYSKGGSGGGGTVDQDTNHAATKSTASVRQTSFSTNSSTTTSTRQKRNWFQKIGARLRRETYFSYKDYDTFSIGSQQRQQRRHLSHNDRPLISDCIEEAGVDQVEDFPVSTVIAAKHKASTISTSATSVSYQCRETLQNSGFLPTIGVTLFLGLHGFFIFTIIICAIIQTLYQRLLLLAFIMLVFVQPRDDKNKIITWLHSVAMWTTFGLSIILQSLSIGVLSLSMILPRDIYIQGGLGRRTIGNWIARQSEKYFGIKTTIEDENAIVETSKKGGACIFAMEPHDIFGYGAAACHQKLERLPSGRVRDTMECLVSSAMVNAPILRQISYWIRCGPVQKTHFRRKLREKESVVFVPGGVKEVFLMDPNNNDLMLYLKKRKGFVKLALETGTPICPVFCFGLDGSFAHLIPRGPMINKLSELVGFTPLLYFGRWGIPFGIPRPQKIHVVFGKLIDVPFRDNVIEEDINYYHELFLTEMESLFERHKIHEEDYLGRTLKIM